MKLNEIIENFEQLPDSEKVVILEKALLRMQSYNGRSRGECISWAMGYLKSGNEYILYNN